MDNQDRASLIMQVTLPGLKLAANSIIQTLNTMATEAGEPADYRLARGGATAAASTPGRPKKKRHISAEGRRAIAAAQVKRWAKRKKEGAGKVSSGRATREDLLNYAVAHDNTLDPKEFKKDNPNTNMGLLGSLTRYGILKRGKNGTFRVAA